MAIPNNPSVCKQRQLGTTAALNPLRDRGIHVSYVRLLKGKCDKGGKKEVIRYEILNFPKGNFIYKNNPHQ